MKTKVFISIMTVPGLVVLLFLILFNSQEKRDILLRGRAYATSGMGFSNSKEDELSGVLKDAFNKIKAMKLTNNPEVDYSSLMASFLQAAVSLSAKEIARGGDNTMKDLAKRTDKRIRSKINDFKRAKEKQASKTEKERGSGVTTSTFFTSLDLMHERLKSYSPAGSFDYDFASVLTIFHQTVNDLSQVFLENSIDSDLTKSAKKIIYENEQDIEQMLEWKAKRKFSE
ncbi:MAG: DUF305 domain-containing protein [Ignavibacteria bacterium]|jgi:uncharacterized protein (DUF305 family)|nr:DUF305 domain-containing protein [Ignavibacteria bacterium]MCU7501645.1 DUF305 domain-containing protein [Ignavibacteria bacterium]MCU7517766.1 DUF305 domain-containing protein [Ignavibacteria bacterium]